MVAKSDTTATLRRIAKPFKGAKWAHVSFLLRNVETPSGSHTKGATDFNSKAPTPFPPPTPLPPFVGSIPSIPNIRHWEIFGNAFGS
jgi:hypothetical protein